MSSEVIYVTRPFLPPLQEVLPYLEGIWDRRILTNNGPLHHELERRLKAFFGVEGCSLMNNGTSALIAPLLTLPKGSQVITTPFTFVATTHSVAMLGLTPVFADIDPHYFGLTPESVEAAITPETSAILAVHTYGTPCDVDGLAAVADRHGVKLFYDASHAFGVGYQGRNLVAYGDVSTLSFHATKSFNTFEGGAVVSAQTKTEAQINLIKNFGIRSEQDIPEIGFNGKLSEFNSAMGLVQLEHYERTRSMRGDVHMWYMEHLSDISGLEFPAQRDNTDPNYSYFPVLIAADHRRHRDEVFESMAAQNVIARRYFSPLISDLRQYRHNSSAEKDNLPVAHDVASRVLCLPIYPELSVPDRERVVGALRKSL